MSFRCGITELQIVIIRFGNRFRSKLQAFRLLLWTLTVTPVCALLIISVSAGSFVPVGITVLTEIRFLSLMSRMALL
jgi:hypothetical protein